MNQKLQRIAKKLFLLVKNVAYNLSLIVETNSERSRWIYREATMRDNDKTTNKLNTPYRTNDDYAKKKANKVNDWEYDYEFGTGASNLGNTTSRYDYEFGNEANISAKDSPLARGANIADAFSYPASPDTNEGNFGRYNEEYARGNPQNTELNKKENARDMKRRFQDNLRQNYNVEFSEDELIDDECDENCDNCPRRR